MAAILFTSGVFTFIPLAPLAGGADTSSTPENINVTNLGTGEAYVTWTTGSQVSGWVVYGTDPTNLDKTGYDTRGSGVVDTTHHCKIIGADNTTLYYKIVSDGVAYGNDSGQPGTAGDPWGVHLFESSGSGNPSINVFQVELRTLASNGTPVRGVIGYLYLTRGNSTTLLASAISDQYGTGGMDGSLRFDLGRLRNPDGTFFDHQAGDQIHFRLQGGHRGVYPVNGGWDVNYTRAVDDGSSYQFLGNFTVEVQQSPPPPTPYPLYGDVEDESGNPVDGATVTAYAPGYGQTSTTTDANGSFTLDLSNIPGYTPASGDTVYINATSASAYDNQSLVLNGNPPQYAGTLVLNTGTPPPAPPYDVYGLVVDSGNNSLGGVEVHIQIPGYGEGVTYTGTDGHFTCDITTIGGYVPSAGDTIYVLVFNGSGVEENRSVVLTGSPPQDTGVYVLSGVQAPTFSDVLTPPVQDLNVPLYLAVNISDPDGVANATAYYRMPGETWWSTIFMALSSGTNTSGTWEAWLPASALYGECHYYVRATDTLGYSSQLGDQSNPLSFLVTDGAPTRDPYIIFGTVSLAGSPAASASVEVLNTATNESWNTVTDSSGGYQANLANLPHAYSDGDVIEVHAVSGSYEGYGHGTVNTSDPVQTLRIDITLYPMTHIVEGYVFWPGGYRTAAGVAVNVTNNNTGDWAVVFTNTSGYYSVDLGNTTLYPNGYGDGDAIWVHATYSTLSGDNSGAVDLNHSALELNVTLQGMHAVEGFVYYGASPVAGASVTVTNLNTGDAATTTTNATGYYYVDISDPVLFSHGFAQGDTIRSRATWSNNSGLNQTLLDVSFTYTWLNVTITPGFQMVLSRGWNLISFPLLISNMTASDLAVLIGWNEVELISMRNTTGGYTVYIPDWTDNASAANFQILNDYGYWVYINVDSITFTINGTAPSPWDVRNITLYDGWNMVGWTSLNSTTLASTFLDYAVGRDNYSAILYWNEITQQWSTAYITEFHTPGGSYDFYIEPGRGYFLTTGTGYLTYSPPPQ
ncbi:MAG: carboxypeptidase regulatory-like domain-containing protein [Thermoplasmata archaeon]|nr:carboxypeptidase regulatory-like domain-containing protein [Thermoplasmata archaeon]